MTEYNCTEMFSIYSEQTMTNRETDRQTDDVI